MNVTELLIAVAAGLTAAGVVWRQAIRPVVRGVQKMVTKLDDLDRVSQAVHLQLIPNGGQSLADRIDKAALEAQAAALDAKDARRTARRVEAKVKKLEQSIAVGVTPTGLPSAPGVTARRRS